MKEPKTYRNTKALVDSISESKQSGNGIDNLAAIADKQGFGAKRTHVWRGMTLKQLWFIVTCAVGGFTLGYCLARVFVWTVTGE